MPLELVAAGTVEEWTVVNATPELHVFHIHQTDFQVVEINSVAQPFIGHQDSINVPYQADDTAPPGQVKLLIDFRRPLIFGKFVYHCHILEHEDGGMMAVAEVVAPPGTVAALRGTRKTLADEPASGRRPTIPWLRANLLKTIDTAVAGAFSRIDAGSAGARIEETFTAVQRASLCRSDR